MSRPPNPRKSALLGLAVVALGGCQALNPPGTDGGLDAGDDAGASHLCDGGFCAPQLLVGELVDPMDVAVDDSTLYWLEYGLDTAGLDGKVMAMAKGTTCLKADGGCDRDLNTQPLGRFRVDSLVKVGDDLCWTENYGNARDVTCQSVSTNAERNLAQHQPWAVRLASDGTDLFWANYGVSTSDGAVMKRGLAGGSLFSIANARPEPTSVAATSDSWLWTEAGLNLDAGAVLAVPKAGGGRVQVASNQRGPMGLVACGDAVFWANYTDGQIMTGATTANSGVVLVAGQKHPFALACDAEAIFWLNEGVSNNRADGELWRAQLDGGDAAPMVRGIGLAFALALDGDAVYYIEQGTVTRIDGKIWRILKRRQ